jgi:hypothetical protein
MYEQGKNFNLVSEMRSEIIFDGEISSSPYENYTGPKG